MDTNYTKELICPYCNYEYSDSWEYQDAQDKDVQTQCPECEKNFIYSTDYDITFSSYKCDCLNGGEHIWRKPQNLWEDVWVQTCKTCNITEKVTKTPVLTNELPNV